MKKLSSLPSYKVADMAKEYRFDYSKAKPNRFAEKMNMGSTMERCVGNEGKLASKKPSAKAKHATKKKK